MEKPFKSSRFNGHFLETIQRYFCFSEKRRLLTIFFLVFAIGVPLGFLFPPHDPNYPEPWRRISGVIGWIYFTAWSISFWPQVFINARRRSVVGLSFEFTILNLVGFSCYTAYNCAFFWNTSIRAAYAAANNGLRPSVQSNDVFFGIHAVAVTLITCIQIIIYERGSQTLAQWCIAVLVIIFASIILVAAYTWTGKLSWLHYLIFLSYVKLSITLMKYFPQAFLNCRRKSTVGWSIENVLMDFVGGSLSLTQSLMDNGIKGQWIQIFGVSIKSYFIN